MENIIKLNSTSNSPLLRQARHNIPTFASGDNNAKTNPNVCVFLSASRLAMIYFRGIYHPDISDGTPPTNRIVWGFRILPARTISKYILYTASAFTGQMRCQPSAKLNKAKTRQPRRLIIRTQTNALAGIYIQIPTTHLRCVLYISKN